MRLSVPVFRTLGGRCNISSCVARTLGSTEVLLNNIGHSSTSNRFLYRRTSFPSIPLHPEESAVFGCNQFCSLRNFSSHPPTMSHHDRFVHPSTSFPTVSSDQLANQLTESAGKLDNSLDCERRFFVLDCSWLNLPSFGNRDASEEFVLVGHIPGSLFFDIDAMSDQNSPYPHMLPKPEVFQQNLHRLLFPDGNSTAVGNEAVLEDKKRQYVLYDSVGIFSAPRVWWMLKTFGYDNVSVLDGGFPKWLSEGKPVQTGGTKPCPNTSSTDLLTITAPPPQRVYDYDSVNALINAYETNNGEAVTKDGRHLPLLVDCRSSERFHGTAKEPRPHLPSGSVPHSVNLPFTNVLDICTQTNEVTKEGLEYTKYKSQEELSKVFKTIGLIEEGQDGRLQITGGRDLIFTCGSGVTSAVVYLALHQCGIPLDNLHLYDGSWTEWKERKMAEEAEGI